MPQYAHSRIEHEGRVWDRGDRVPQDLPGIAALKKSGAVSSKKYEGDPVAEAAAEARANELEAELKEIRSGDNGTAGEARK